MSKLMLPTGYEDEQKKAEAKRKIAQMMLEKGLQSQGNMQSWLQVLGQMGTAFAGKRLEDKADKMDADVNDKMLNDYHGQLDAFNADAKTLSPADIVAKYQDKPFLEDAVKPYVEALTARLKDKGEMVNDHGVWKDKGNIHAGDFSPNDPNASVLRGPGNTFIENDVRRSAALHAQGYDMGGAGASMPDPMAGGNPPVAAATNVGLPPSGSDALDLSLLSPDEKQIMTAELKRRASQNGAYTPPNSHVPMGNPLTAQKAPAGVVNGKPYWLINGVAFDNPEGK